MQLAFNGQIIYNLFNNIIWGFTMKWILLIGVTLLGAGCCCTTAEVVEYRRVTVAPVVQPVLVDVFEPGPLDVTTTTIDFY